MTLLDECLAAAADLPAPPPTVWMFEADYLDLLARLRHPVTRVLTRAVDGRYRVDGWPIDPRRQTSVAALYGLLVAGEAGVPHADVRIARRAAKRAWKALDLPGAPPLRALGDVLVLLPQESVRLGAAVDWWAYSSAMPTWKALGAG